MEIDSVRIGIFGGTFNPVHLGHLIVAQDACDQFELNRVLFVPCAVPPHKTTGNLAENPHRLRMLEACLEGDPHFEFSDIEIERGGVSYTIDTVRALRQQDPSAEWFLILGSDSLMDLHSWRQAEAILKEVQIGTLIRPGTPLPTSEALRLPAPWPERLLGNVRVGHQVEISSGDIRRRCAEGLSIRYLVHPAVEMYIAEHGLYVK
jgi:nicotinate-nucleotide adenylyltransferase